MRACAVCKPITWTCIRCIAGTRSRRSKKRSTPSTTSCASGKVRYIGASNFTGYQLQRAVDLARAHHWAAFTCLQPQYNLLCRQIEWEVIPVCADEGIGVIPWSPLRGGWLSGKFRRGMETPPEDTRIGAQQTGGENWRANNNEYTWNVLDALLAVAGEVDKSRRAGRAALAPATARCYRADHRGATCRAACR